ncbi:toll/interleukin-1 receptor domain-containing protein [Terricaulis sp.]|uniref:toll/interleukin-1 receptor domain-containing protein n=1 Tax=Terricaulis sp. TaxID=2768686 RepID=UPI003783A7C6
MADVFISYKREEREKVLLIADRLRAYGLDVWFDARLTTGHHFDQEIDQHVRTAKCVLVCWSSAALTSEWVRAEAAIGRERGVIVPLMIEPCTLPVPFNTMQTEDLSRWAGEGDHEGWTRVIERVGQLVKRKDLVAAEQARGAQELETKRIQAMLDAQRREEEQARRSADAAAAETARLEAELRSRGVAAVAGAPTGARAGGRSKPPKRQKEKTPSAPGPKGRGLVLRVVGALVLAAVIGGGGWGGGYYFGHDDGEDEGRFYGRNDQRRSIRQSAVAAIAGDWCKVDGPWADVAIRDAGTGFEYRQRTSSAWTPVPSHSIFDKGISFELNGASVIFVRRGDYLTWHYGGGQTRYAACAEGRRFSHRVGAQEAAVDAATP